MSFDLDEFLRRNPKLLSSTQWEDYLRRRNSPVEDKPRWLEDVGLDPTRCLGEGEYKNYLYEKSRIDIKPLKPFNLENIFDK